MNMYLKLFCVLILAHFFYAIDASNPVTIINSNNGEALLAAMSKDAQISVFGATPRYSFFRSCMDILRQNLKELDEAYNHNKRLKGVQHTIKQIVYAFKKMYPEKSAAQHFSQLPERDLIKLFFKIGFKESILKGNIDSLSACAQQGERSNSSQQKVLIHLLLPMYFDDCVSEKPSLDSIKVFLQESARFYQNMYQQIEGAPHTIIYIPPYAYFEDVLGRQGSDMLSQSNEALTVQLLKAELFDYLPETAFLFINQNAPQLVALASLLEKQGISRDRMKLIELILTYKLKQTQSFNSYALPFKEEDLKVDAKTSPLITDDLINLLCGDSQ